MLHCKKDVSVFETNLVLLAKKIDEFCNEDFYNTAVEKTKQLKQELSFETLTPLYNQVFQSLINKI